MTQQRSSRQLPPDARIVRPENQPQRYDSNLAGPPRLPATMRPMGGNPVGQALREFIETILPAVLIALLIHLFLAQATRVEGYSMEPTLHGQQRLVIEKLTYRFQTPERGDIVVLRIPGYGRDMLIKRVIGLPGETIEVRGGEVYINGQALPEAYLQVAARGNYPLTVVPPDHVFVMGDNRNNSNDSRSFGPVSMENVVGQAWVRYWPLTDFGFVD